MGHRIKVVENKREAVDLLSIGDDELNSILEVLCRREEYDHPGRDKKFISYGQSIAFKLLIDKHKLLEDISVKFTSEIDEVRLRQILNSDAVIPVISFKPTNMRTRAGIKKEALIENPAKVKDKKPYVNVSIAAEQPFFIAELKFCTNKQFGEIIRTIFPSVIFKRTLDCFCKTGMYTSQMLSIMVNKPRIVSNSKLLLGKQLLSLGKQLEYADNFHNSTAGCMLAFSKIKCSSRVKQSITLGDFIKTIDTRTHNKVLVSLVSELSKYYSEISSSKDEFIYPLSPLSSLFRINAMHIYLYALSGRDELVRDFILYSEISKNRHDELSKIEEKYFKEETRSKNLRRIIEQKFGIIISPNIEIDKALLEIGKKEREIVLAEYNKEIKQWEAEKNNTCGHIKAVRRLREAKSSSEAVKLLKDLSIYFARPHANTQKNDEWIKCASCRYNIICPHVLEFIRLSNENATYNFIREVLNKFALKIPTAGEENRFSSFCRICGEELYKFIPENEYNTAELLGEIGTLDDSLKSAFTAEAFNAIRDLRFTTFVNTKKLAFTASDICRTALLVYNQELLKRHRGLNTVPSEGTEEIPIRTKVYISIFVYAYFLSMIEKNKTIGLEGVDFNAPLKTYVLAVKGLILRRNAKLLTMLEMSEEYITNIYKDAYRMFAGRSKLETVKDEAMIILEAVSNVCPVFLWGSVMVRIMGECPLLYNRTPEQIRDEFEKVMGKKISTILHDRADTSKSKLVQYLLGIRQTDKGVRHVPAEYPPEYDPIYVTKLPEVNFYNTLYDIPEVEDKIGLEKYDITGSDTYTTEAVVGGKDTYTTEAVVGGRDSTGIIAHGDTAEIVTGGRDARRKKKVVAKHTKKRETEMKKKKETIKIKPKHIPRFTKTGMLKKAEEYIYRESYRLLVKIVKTPEFVNTEYLREKERGYIMMRNRLSISNIVFRIYSSRREFVSRDLPISYIYDEEGIKHTWMGGKGNIYIKDEKGRIIDEQCGKCGIKLSEYNTLNIEKIEEALKLLNEFNNFFDLYYSRCPEGDLHTFENDVCTKCGATAYILLMYDTPEYYKKAQEYFNKYYTVYKEQKEEINTPSSSRALSLKEYVRLEDADWTYDYSKIIGLSQFLRIPPSVVEAFGSYEGQSFSDIEENKMIIEPIKDKDDYRINAIDSIVRMFIVEYNRVRFVNRISRINPLTLDILRSSNIQDHQYEELATTMPDIAHGYRETRRRIYINRTGEDVFLYSLEFLANMCLKLGESGDLLQKTAAEKIMSYILSSEKLLSKHGTFNYKIFGDETVSASIDTGIGETDAAVDVAEDATPDDSYIRISLDEMDIDEEDAEANLEVN